MLDHLSHSELAFPAKANGNPALAFNLPHLPLCKKKGTNFDPPYQQWRPFF